MVTDTGIPASGLSAGLSASSLKPTASPVEIDSGRINEPITGRTWGTIAECRYAAILVHGLGAHSGWFEAFGRRLKVRRVYALAYDQLGFGKRRNQRFLSAQQWIDDLVTVYQHVKSQVGDMPVYLIGNSMGALITLAAVESINPDGLIMFSPGFEGYPGTFTLKFRLGAIFSALTQPDREVSLPYATESVSRDASIREWINQDPERRMAVPGRMLLELLKLTRRVSAQHKNVRTPLLMATAGIDRVVDNRVNMMAFSKFGCSNKTHKCYQESWHDLMFDPAIDEVADEAVGWMTNLDPLASQV